MKYFASFFLALVAASAVDSATIRVPSDQATIQSGVNAASANDTVLVAPGTYVEHVNFGGKPVYLVSSGGRDSTVIKADVNNVAGVLVFSSGEDTSTVVDGFTIDGANMTRSVHVYNASPIIQNCDVKHALGPFDGGGIYCYNSSMKIRYCRIHDNNTQSCGAGICPEGTGSRVLEISHNEIYNNLGSAPGIGCLYVNNLYVHHNLIRNNLSTTWAGGGIYMNGGGANVSIINNTIVGNSHGFVTYASPQPLVLNNIIVSNQQRGIDSGITSRDYNDVWNNATDNSPGSNGISADPRFVDTTNHNYQLQLGSPCIDAGNPDPKYDDPDGSRNDIGAYFRAHGYPYVSNINLGPENMTHVVNRTPTIHWSYHDTLAVQHSYQLEVGTDTNWTAAEVWNTGEVISSDSAVVYAGLALQPGTTYYTRIQVSNGVSLSPWTTASFRVNTAPTKPTLLFPLAGSHPFSSFSLRIQNSFDAESDTCTYDFEIYTDGSLGNLFWSQTKVPQQKDSTSSAVVAALGGQNYWWRSRAFDGFEYSSWSDLVSFATRTDKTIHVPGDVATIQAAVNVPLVNDTVLVAPGTYVEHISFAGKPVYLVSSGGRDVTVIRADVSSAAVLTFSSGEDTTTVVDGFTIDGTNITRGIYDSGASPIIQNCDLQHALGPKDGGGIYCYNSSMKIRYCRIHDNNTWSCGAGICPEGTGTRILEISYNEIYGNQGNAPAIGCLYVNNLYVHHNLIRNNTGNSWAAGGIYLNGGGSNVSIINNAIVGNTHGLVTYASPQPLVLDNIIVSNQQRGIDPGITSRDYNDVWGNLTDNSPGPNGISADPRFVDTTNHNYRLRPGSPCFNTGDPDPSYNDPDGTRNDIGAFYHQAVSPGPFSLISPPDSSGLPVFTFLPTFSWTPASDTGVGDTVKYRLEISPTDKFLFVYAKDSIVGTSSTLTDSLDLASHYWWRVTGKNLDGQSVVGQSVKNFWTWRLGDLNHDGTTDLGDLSLMVSYLTNAGGVISPKLVGDLNGDCRVDLLDLTRLVSFLTGGGAALLPGCSGTGAPAAKAAQVAHKSVKFGRQTVALPK